MADNTSDSKTVLNEIELNKNDLNIENLHGFHKKNKMINEAENILDYKTEDPKMVTMNQNDVDIETLSKSCKKKRKKHEKQDENRNLSDCDIQELATDELEKNRILDISDNSKKIDEFNDLNAETLNGPRKKKKHKLHVKMEHLSDFDLRESAIDELGRKMDFDASDAPRRIKKCKQTNDSKTIDSNSIEMNYTNLIPSKAKRKKHEHKMPDIDNKLETGIQSKNLNNSNVYEYLEEVKEKSSAQNAADDKSIGRKKEPKVGSESEVDIILDNLPENKKDATCKITMADDLSDYKTVSTEIELNNNVLSIGNLHGFHKKKKHKFKIIDESENLSDHKTEDSNVITMNQNDFNDESLGKPPKKKRKKHKKTDEMKKLSDCDIKVLATDEIGKNTILDVSDNSKRIDAFNDLKAETLNGPRKKKKHKLHVKKENLSDCDLQESDTDKQVEKIDYDASDFKKLKERFKKCKDYYRKTVDSNAIEINYSNLKVEFIDNLHKIKRKKHKHKLPDIDNSLETGIQSRNLNNSNVHEYLKEVKEKSIVENAVDKKSLKRKKEPKECSESEVDILLDNLPENKKVATCKITMADNSSDYKTVVSNEIELNNIVLSSGNLHGFHKKKKNKYKMTDELENILNYKTEDSNVITMNQNDLNSETLSFSSKKKKKHKKIDEKRNLTDCDIQEWATDELEKNRILDVSDNSKRIDEFNDLNTETLNGSRNKKKQKLCEKMENLSDCDKQELATDDLKKKMVFELSDAPKRIKICKQNNDCKTMDSNAIEINYTNLIPSKAKRKKHEHKMSDLDSRLKTGIEPNNSLNNCIDHEYLKEVKEKCFEQNAVEDRSLGIKRKSKDSFESENEVKLDNLPAKKNSSTCKISEKESNVEVISNNLSEKEKNVTCKRLEKEKNDTCKSPKDEMNGARKKEMNFKGPRKRKSMADENPGEEQNYQDEDSYISFDSSVFDMADVPVPFIIPALHEGETAATLLPKEKEYLEANGVKIRTGKWTKTEDDILTRNFLQFGLEFGVNNPFQLLGINQSKRNKKLAKFLNAKHFLARLGKDLNDRSLRSIYMRARKLFNPLKNQRKLSVGEASDLKNAHELVGNKWTRISDMLHRSDGNCHTAYRWHKSDINKGKWTPEEERDLIKAIKAVSGAEDISANNVKNISWKEVAKYVPTRNEFQCQKQWANHHAWDSSVTEKKSWQKCHYGKLIYLIKDEYCFNSESEIDFKELHKHFIDVAPSHIFLRKKWLYLKGRVPKEVNLNFGLYLDTLMKKYEEQYKIFVNEGTVNS